MSFFGTTRASPLRPAVGFAAASLVLIAFADVLAGKSEFFDPFEVMAEVRRLEARPPVEGPVPIGFAPKAVRALGYLEGRWIADLLDRFDRGWKEDAEAGRIAYLEDRLGEVLPPGPSPAAFTAEEENRWTGEVRTAFSSPFVRSASAPGDCTAISSRSSEAAPARRNPADALRYE